MQNLHLQFVIAFFVGWVNRSKQALIEYLKTKNEIYSKSTVRNEPGLPTTSVVDSR